MNLAGVPLVSSLPNFVESTGGPEQTHPEQEVEALLQDLPPGSAEKPLSGEHLGERDGFMQVPLDRLKAVHTICRVEQGRQLSLQIASPL